MNYGHASRELYIEIVTGTTAILIATHLLLARQILPEPFRITPKEVGYIDHPELSHHLLSAWWVVMRSWRFSFAVPNGLNAET